MKSTYQHLLGQATLLSLQFTFLSLCTLFRLVVFSSSSGESWSLGKIGPKKSAKLVHCALAISLFTVSMKGDWRTDEDMVVTQGMKGKDGGGVTSVKPRQKLLWYLIEHGPTLFSISVWFFLACVFPFSIFLCLLLSFILPRPLFLIQLWQAKYNESLIQIFLPWMHFPAPGNLISCFCSCQLIGVYVQQPVSYNLFVFRSLFHLSSTPPLSFCLLFSFACYCLYEMFQD